MKKLIMLIVLVVALNTPVYAQLTDWDDSPRNWKNSERNWDNSSRNWENSPRNWENSPRNSNSERIIRDNRGNATGYAVEKPNSDTNYYDSSGRRTGYGR